MVVLFIELGDCCCGVGYQFGYFYSEGDYILLMDGDMEFEFGFIDCVVIFLEVNLEYVGVVGMVEMDEVVNYEFIFCKQCFDMIYLVGDCDYLGGGGLYCCFVIRKIGYLINCNLYVYEEVELGFCLLEYGYKLYCLNIFYFCYMLYMLLIFKMLCYCWWSGYYQGMGEILCSVWGKLYFLIVVKMVKSEVVFLLYLMLLVCLVFMLNMDIVGVVLLLLFVFIVFKIIKNCLLVNGLYSVMNMIICVVGLLKGLM